MDFSNAGVTEQVDGAFRAHVQRSDKGSTGRHIHGPRRPDEAAAKEDLESMRAAASGMSREDGFAAMKAEAVTGGPPLQAPLAMYPFGIKEGPNGTSLAMYPSVVFAFQAQGYVSKGRHFLSDAPFRRFPAAFP